MVCEVSTRGRAVDVRDEASVVGGAGRCAPVTTISHVSAGWYPEPHGASQLLRYRDGSRWTEHTDPAGGQRSRAAAQVQTAPAQARAPAQPQAQVPHQQAAPPQQAAYQQAGFCPSRSLIGSPRSRPSRRSSPRRGRSRRGLAPRSAGPGREPEGRADRGRNLFRPVR
ncbi:DUF2510 domain-containing protein [Streptomyces sp. NPDC056930]|uniref:DUF2510 domain-containing protein n=1 Tax=Streptomyces sp. NPDC056930 TaxID=3345967 RepID=UPI0036411421